MNDDDYKKVIVLPDLHDSPDIPKDRFRWIGRYLTKEQPDAVINIGDTADMESLCSHVKNETFHGKFKPSYIKDVASLNEALGILYRNYKPKNKPIMHVTLGNHEHRAWTYADANPEMYGMQDYLTKVFENNGWSWSKYGEYYNYSGVDFTHVPFNSMGRPTSSLNQIANKSNNDVVFGHTHRFDYLTAPKFGPNRKVTVVNVGCGLPWGHVQNYAKLSSTGWWWGVVKLTIYKNRIESCHHKPMFELEKEFGYY